MLALVALAVLWLRPGQDESLPPPPTDVAGRPDRAAAVLRSVETAVLDRDADALDGQVAEPALARRIAGNAARLQVRDFSLRYLEQDESVATDDGEWAASVEASWAFAGFDDEPARAEATVTFRRRGDRAVLVSVGGGGRAAPLWLTRAVTVHRSANALVLSAGDPARRYAEYADRAVRMVRRVIPRWSQRLVVEVPRSGTGLDRLLGSEPGTYANIAAVTTTADGSGGRTAPVHVFVNPDLFDDLPRQGAQVVMTHEVAHVATGAATASGIPLWLMEGFADYVALRDLDVPVSVSARQILRQVRRNGVPDALPGPEEFDPGTTHLGASYEAAWLACRLLARTGSEEDLVSLYRRVSSGEAVDTSLRDVFGFGEKELVRRWQAELRALAR